MRIREEGPNEGKSTQKGRCPPPPGAVLGSGDTGRSTMTDTSWYAGQEGRAEGGDRVSHLEPGREGFLEETVIGAGRDMGRKASAPGWGAAHSKH